MQFFNFVNLVGFLLLLNKVASKNEKYFEMSMLALIEEFRNSFSSQIEIVDPIAKDVHYIKESFSFSSLSGDYNGLERQEDNRLLNARIIYLGSTSEIYQIEKGKKVCSPFVLDEATLEIFHNAWAPQQVFEKKLKYNILGKYHF